VIADMHVAIEPGIVAFTSAHPLHDDRVAQASAASDDAPESIDFDASLSGVGKHDAEQFDIAHSNTPGPQERQLDVEHASTEVEQLLSTQVLHAAGTLFPVTVAICCNGLAQVAVEASPWPFDSASCAPESSAPCEAASLSSEPAGLLLDEQAIAHASKPTIAAPETSLNMVAVSLVKCRA
jgi:hypothetical protein